jgi:GTP cyclohydrolase IA
MNLSDRIWDRVLQANANDNVADILYPGELENLELEVTMRVRDLLRTLIIDTTHDHNTQRTAERVAKMLIYELYKGRYQPMPHLTTFPNITGLDEMYATGPITIRSSCSHHMVPIFGKCWIGIVPDHKLMGLSKFNRLVEWISARPQIQEEMTQQIADLIESQLQPKGLAVLIKASHMCMTLRGVREGEEAVMTTSVLRGVIKDKPAARSEFFSLVNK